MTTHADQYRSSSVASAPAEVMGNDVHDENSVRHESLTVKQEQIPSPVSSTAVANDAVVAPHLDIIAALERQCAAWNAGDIQAYMNGYAEDAIYVSQSILQTRKVKASQQGAEDVDKKDVLCGDGDICLHGHVAIATLFADVLERSHKQQNGRFCYRQLQIQYATTDRAFVMGRYEFTTSQDHKVVDAGIFTLDMAHELVTARTGGAAKGQGDDDDNQSREWKIKTEHASSSFRKRK